MIALQRVSYTYPFHSQAAVTDVSFSIAPGEAVLVTGPSGCGKSTIVRLINGLCPHFFKGRLKGRVCVNAMDNADRRLSEISRDIGSLFQDPEHQFFATNVEDEIAFVHEWQDNTPETIREKVIAATSQFELTSLLSQSIHTLSEGQKQKVALAGIISMAPRALVMDEPTANLDPESTLNLAQTIHALKQSGMAIVIVDHRLYWLESVVDSVIVMDRGKIAVNGNFAMLYDRSLQDQFGLRQAQVADVRPRLKNTPNGNTKIRVENLCFGYGHQPDLFRNVNFSLSPGVTGLFGKNGTGKTTLARLLTGLATMRSGQFFVGDEAVTARQLLARSRIVLQNTDHQLHMKSVSDEVKLSINGSRTKSLKDLIEATLLRFGLAKLTDRHPQSLSGGEKQRLVIACALVKNPEILILDEPTSGLDGGNMRIISDCMRMAADNGACVLLISHDLELIHLNCDSALHLPFQVQATEGDLSC